MFKKTIGALALILLASVTFAKTWEFSKEETQTSQQMAKLLATRYYDKDAFNEGIIEKNFDAYFRYLDFNKAFFLSNEIKDFKKQTKALSDAILNGNLGLPSKIYSLAYDRQMQRYKNNIKLLENVKANFDLKTEARIKLDRTKSNWFNTQRELDSYWQKRLIHEILSIIEADDKTPEQAGEQLKKRYARQINYLEQVKPIDVYQLYMDSVATSFDPHTNYLSPRMEDDFSIHMKLSLTGIGATLSSDQDYTKVHSLVPGGPADKQGELQAEDKIIAVAQGDKEFVDVVGMRLGDVVDQIRGEKGTKVRLKITRNKETKEISIIRNIVNLADQAASKRILVSKDKKYKLGIINIPTFYMDFDAASKGVKDYRSTSRDVAKLVEELKKAKVDGILIDLRNNGGGSLQEVSDMVGLFIERGPSVQIRSANGKIDVLGSNANRQIYTGALGVLINRASASASEIFAAAMADYGRALILGDTSFGKGTVQSILDLKLGQLKITQAKFYRVSGESTQHKGVVPDIFLPSPINHDLIGESALPNALKWDEIRAVVKDRREKIDSVIAKLGVAYNRLKFTPDYKYLAANADFIKSHNNSTFSLNLITRGYENKAYEKERLDMINAWRTAHDKKAYKDFKTWQDDIKETNKKINASKQTEPAFELLGSLDQAELLLTTELMQKYTLFSKAND